MKIVRLESNDCGGFQKPKGHLDTQMFPECAGTETDRNIVKKTVEKRKKNKGKTRASNETQMIKEAAHGWPIESDGNRKGLWQRWIDNEIDDRKFVLLIKNVAQAGWVGISKDPTVRSAIVKSVNEALKVGDYNRAANRISSALSMGKKTHEKFVGNNKESKNMKINKIELEAKKKKKWNPNPWAVCHTTVDKDKDPEKYERCVMDVKKKQAFNLKKYINSISK